MSRQTFNEPPWSVPVAIADIPETGRRLNVSADEHTRAAVAKIAGVVALPKLEAEFDLMRHSSDGVRVIGSVLAQVEQRCVVTLEPIESDVEEMIDLIFVPQQAEEVDDDAPASVPPSGEPPEVLRDGVVDLGLVATEFLLLGIDPYPRKPGVVFEAPKQRENPASHPFAALAALKKGTKETES